MSHNAPPFVPQMDKGIPTTTALEAVQQMAAVEWAYSTLIVLKENYRSLITPSMPCEESVRVAFERLRQGHLRWLIDAHRYSAEAVRWLWDTVRPGVEPPPYALQYFTEVLDYDKENHYATGFDVHCQFA